jgi:hypothetical protein
LLSGEVNTLWPSQLKPYQKLKRFWTVSKSGVETALHGEHEIAALEAKYNVRMPAEFREYLLTCCPSSDQRMDNNLTDWWCLPRIKNIPPEYKYNLKNSDAESASDKYLFFADYCIWCSAWAIDCSSGANRGRIISVDGVHDRFVADSFSEFVDKFIQHEQQLI